MVVLCCYRSNKREGQADLGKSLVDKDGAHEQAQNADREKDPLLPRPPWAQRSLHCLHGAKKSVRPGPQLYALEDFGNCGSGAAAKIVGVLFC